MEDDARGPTHEGKDAPLAPGNCSARWTPTGGPRTYLSVGQIYLYDNPLLKEPLGREHIKPRLLGHWGTTPARTFLYVHLNRIINDYDLNMIYISGLDTAGRPWWGTRIWRGRTANITRRSRRTRRGLKRAVHPVSSFSGGQSPATSPPETPGSIHEGGELGIA